MRANFGMVVALCATSALAASCLAKRGAGGGDGSQAGGGSDGTAGGDVGGESAGGSGLAATSCATCVQGRASIGESCEIDYLLCGQDPDCNAWWDCIDHCAAESWTGSCTADCGDAFPGAVGMGYGLLTCLCVSCSADPDCGPLCG